MGSIFFDKLGVCGNTRRKVLKLANLDISLTSGYLTLNAGLKSFGSIFLE
jgi:hypothetical protein